MAIFVPFVYHVIWSQELL